MKFLVIPGFDPSAFEKYLKNTGWLLIARIGSLFLKLIVGFAVANYLGATNNGLLNYPIAFVTFFAAAAALGLEGIITRELIQNPSNKNYLLGTAITMRLLSSLLIIPILLFSYIFFNQGGTNNLPFSFILITSSVLLFQACNILDSYFQSIVQARKIMLAQLSANIFSAAFKILLIFFKAKLIWFVTAISIDVAILAIFYLYIFQKSGNSILDLRFNTSLAKSLFKKSWPLAFSTVLVTIYMKIDQIMIMKISGEKALGIYTTVVGLSESWYFLPVAIVSSIFPALVNARKDDVERYQKRLTDLYDLMVMLSITIGLIMTFSSGLLYDIIYKPEFRGGSDVLIVHIWAGVFVFLGTASSQYLLAEGFTFIALLRTGLGAIVNIILNIFWIPKYGIIGAAYATLIAYAVATFFILLLPKTNKQGVLMLKSLFLISLFQKITKH